MKNYPVTVSIIGLGARGLDTYAALALKEPGLFKIVAVADTRPGRLQMAREMFNIPAENCFETAEQLLAQPKLSDAIFVCTQDRDHFAQAQIASDKGYDILLEKPIAPSIEEVVGLRDHFKKNGTQSAVCHVMRYTVFFREIKKLLEQNVIGDIMAINLTECVGYFHFAHSYVRGNWRDSSTASPVILAKCCHDMDILQWLLGKRCLRLSSFGGLKYFKKENAPEGSAVRCFDCKAREGCPYDCEKVYISGEHGICGINKNDGWPVNVVVSNPTEEKVRKALSEGPYGRCVFACDNDVADSQTVTMEFEGGVTVNFMMSAFTEKNTRIIKIMGTHGEIWGDLYGSDVHVQKFGEPEQLIDVSKLTDDLSGHAGGDNNMLKDFFSMLCGGEVSSSMSPIEVSTDSHIMAFKAEESRVNGGEVKVL